MRKLLFLSLVILMAFGCSNEEQENLPPQEVTVNIDYAFWESGSMTKAGADLYADFYEKYIKTKLITPKNYSLGFKNKETNAIASIKGKWDNKDGIKLLEGEYEITGTSSPVSVNKLDTLYMSFNETVTINNNTANITLTAKHNSYMLLFDKENIKSIEYSAYDGSRQRRYEIGYLDDVYYMFINNLLGGKEDYLTITRNNDVSSTIHLTNIPFEKGKYYYFNDITNSFDIPPMTEGN